MGADFAFCPTSSQSGGATRLAIVDAASRENLTGVVGRANTLIRPTSVDFDDLRARQSVGIRLPGTGERRARLSRGINHRHRGHLVGAGEFQPSDGT